SMPGGSIDTRTGTLVLNGALPTNAAAASATIAGKLDLGGGTRTFTVARGTSPTTDLDISAAISNGGVTKNGAGGLRYSGGSPNTYTGTTTVNAGLLALRKNAVAIRGDLGCGGRARGPGGRGVSE